ncbi:dynein assembly factor 4, axonemal [Orussus abietinus]|uniref:dynein assembly factor 4, axonemal n=1 Tax=Orussus abietinus TaxID=222816 RepID=UPI000626A7E1|nr:dynein assembly factor 4, axonemal [Orussus abietinus]
MPVIVVKDYAWRQTAESVIIYVPLSGHPKKVDLFVIDDYMKASYPPFILELFLWGNILDDRSECTLDGEEAIFSLKKENAGEEWPTLVKENLSKENQKECRNQAQERARLSMGERAKARSEKRNKLQKDAVRAQIDLDTKVLNKIERMRDAHRKEAMQEFDDWKSEHEAPIFQHLQGALQRNNKAYRPPLKWFKDEFGAVTSEPATDDMAPVPKPDNNTLGKNMIKWEKAKAEIFSDKQLEGESREPKRAQITEVRDEEEYKETRREEHSERNRPASSSENADSKENPTNGYASPETVIKDSMRKFHEQKQRRDIKTREQGVENTCLTEVGRCKKVNNIFDEPQNSVPRPRTSGTINVTFTERSFPTPARESSHVEEQEWLEKQAEARRKVGFVAENLRPEEQDPQWLKDKGDEFFKAGNYLGAVSAYSHGIKLSDKMASLYVNRSAAHYAIGNYYRCTEDCSKALELMVPQCEGNRESRARCHARRGAALCKLSAPQHGIPELEAALKLAPDNETIKRDLLAAKQYFDIKE